MAAVKVSSNVDGEVWEESKRFAGESHQAISGRLTEAVREHLQRRRVRPQVLDHLQRSVEENREPGELLARCSGTARTPPPWRRPCSGRC